MKYWTLLILVSCVVDLSFEDVATSGRTNYKGNILCLMTIASPSHHIWNRVLMEALAQEGYNVTALSIDADKHPIPNLHYIKVEGVYEAIYQEEEFDLLAYASLDVYSSIAELMVYFKICNRAVLKSKAVRTLLNYPDDFQFDMVIYDYTSLPGALGFLHKFNYPPAVGVSAFMNPPNTYDVNGNPLFPSLLPYYATTFPPKMTFWQRSYNLFYYVVDNYSRKKAIEESDQLAREVFGRDLPSLSDLERKLSVLLVNVHPSVDIPEPMLPNVIAVGGMQVKEPKDLPENIKKFIESSKKGAVLFSLGSNVKSTMLGEERIQMFIRALSKLPEYHFLWKFEEDGLKVPANVMIQKWMPQNDILGHPKVKLFMTHSGLLSTHETTWHGVPMLGIPFFADQHTNIKKAMDAGVAEKLDVFNLSEDNIVTVLRRMLENPSYQTAMSLRSQRFRDRPHPPLQEAVWWCEYVLRHRGAPHLRSAAADMTPLALYMWDLLIVWSAAFLGSLAALVYIMKRMFCNRKICLLKKIDDSSKKTN